LARDAEKPKASTNRTTLYAPPASGAAGGHSAEAFGRRRQKKARGNCSARQGVQTLKPRVNPTAAGG